MSTTRRVETSQGQAGTVQILSRSLWGRTLRLDGVHKLASVFFPFSPVLLGTGPGFQPCLTRDWSGTRLPSRPYHPHVTLDANLTLCFIKEAQRKRKALAHSHGCSSHLLRTSGPLATATTPASCSSNRTQMFAEFSYLGRKQSPATLPPLLSDIQCQTAWNIPFCLFCLPRSLYYPPVAIWLRISVLS